MPYIVFGQYNVKSQSIQRIRENNSIGAYCHTTHYLISIFLQHSRATKEQSLTHTYPDSTGRYLALNNTMLDHAAPRSTIHDTTGKHSLSRQSTAAKHHGRQSGRQARPPLWYVGNREAIHSVLSQGSQRTHKAQSLALGYEASQYRP